MITLVVCIRRASGLSQRQFSEYWRDHHAPLIRSVPDFTRHLASYVQHHLVDANSAVARMFGIAASYDGVAALSFNSAEAMAQTFAEPRYLEIIRPDEPKFCDLDDCLSFITDPFVVV